MKSCRTDKGAHKVVELLHLSQHEATTDRN